jgi:uncharacterized small protein (DUF1192 family)
MSTLVLTDPLIQPEQRRAQRDHASFALRCVLEAEIEALEARLRKRSAIAAVAGGLARADLDQQVGWLRASVAKVQARRDSLYCGRQ